MHYTLHQLQIFQKVVELESITKAAEELHLTQPAVSIQLKKLQDQFTVPLTEVVGRKLYITEFGHEISQAADRILNEVDKINYKTLTYQNKLAGRLKLSIASTGKYVMPYFLSGFMEEHPGVDLAMDVTNKSLVVKSMQNNEVDFSLMSVIPHELEANNEPLLQNKLYLVANKKLAAQIKKHKSGAFADHPLLFREAGSATRKAMEQFIESKDLVPVRKIELTSNEALKQAVIAGLGVSIMPLIGIKNELHNGDIEIISYKGLPIVTQWNLVWLKSKNMSPVAEAFLEYIRNNKEDITHNTFAWYEQY